MKDLCSRGDSLRSRGFRSRPMLFLMTVTLPALLPGQTAVGSQQGSSLAYVAVRDATPNAGSVVAIDTADNQVTASVPVGPGPHGMALTPDGRRAYVANYGTFPAPFAQATALSDTVSVLELSPLQVLATVTVGRGPLGVAVTPNGEEVYVTNFGQDSRLVAGAVEGNTVSVIRTSTNSVVATIQVGALPAGVAIHPDGRRAYVTSRRTDQLWVIDTATHTVVVTIPVQVQPANLAFSPNGERAYVTNFGSNSVSVVDTTAMTALHVPDGDAIKVGLVPIGISLSPDGTRAYVVNAFSNDVSVIDTATNSVIARVNVAQGPRALAITPDGARAYVTNFLNNTVYVINTATNDVANVIPVNGGPNWVTTTRQQRTAAIASPKNVTTVSRSIRLDASQSTSADGSPLTYLWTIAQGSPPAAISGATTATPVVQFSQPHATYTFRLTVTDSTGKSAADSVVVHYAGN